MSEIILNLSENSDNECLSGEGQMVGGVGRVCTDTQTRVCWNTPVLGVSEGQVPLVQLHFSRQQCLTMLFSHTHTLPGSFSKGSSSKQKAFILSRCTFNVDYFLHCSLFGIFIGKLGVAIFSSQLGKLRHGEMS